MIIKILAFLIPHFITRCVFRDENNKMLAVCKGTYYGDQLAIPPKFMPYAFKSPTIEVILGLSWFGYALFFWVKETYDRIET